MMAKKIIIPLLFFLLFISFWGIKTTKAEEIDSINLYFFYGKGCPHCAKEEVFLDKLKKERENIKIHYFEIWNNPGNASNLSLIAKELKVKIRGVPVLIIGDTVISGFLNEETTGLQIRNVLANYENKECVDVVSPILNKESTYEECAHGCDEADVECMHNCGCSADKNSEDELSKKINIPIIGEINIGNFSLPIITLIIGGLDGFNPCAMWILLFLISLLLGMENKKKMWILGGAFIFTSGLVYFLFMAAWLNVLIFFGFVFWIRVLIALFALAGGSYNLRDYVVNKNGGCNVAGEEKRKRIFDKIKIIIQERNFWLALIGIIALAFSVNLIELVCSAGLPAIYTQILSLNNLENWQYYLYLLFYIFIFILDDLLVFIIAMVSLRAVGVTTKYSRLSKLVGGVLMIVIGILLLFKPGWLMFG